jgi:hypothetical protein
MRRPEFRRNAQNFRVAQNSGSSPQNSGSPRIRGRRLGRPKFGGNAPISASPRIRQEARPTTTTDPGDQKARSTPQPKPALFRSRSGAHTSLLPLPLSLGSPRCVSSRKQMSLISSTRKRVGNLEGRGARAVGRQTGDQGRQRVRSPQAHPGGLEGNCHYSILQGCARTRGCA